MYQVSIFILLFFTITFTRFDTDNDKIRQFIVKFEKFEISISVNFIFEFQQQFVRFEFKIIKNNVQSSIIIQSFFNVTINDFMIFVRDFIDVKINRKIELLKIDFNIQFEKQTS